MRVTKTVRRRYWRRRYVPTVTDPLSVTNPYGASTWLVPSAPLYFGTLPGFTARGARFTDSATYRDTDGAVMFDGAAYLAEWKRRRNLMSVVVETVTVTDYAPRAPRSGFDPTGAVFSVTNNGAAMPIPDRVGTLRRHLVNDADRGLVVTCSAESDTPDSWLGAATVRRCTVPRSKTDGAPPCGAEYRPVVRDVSADRAASWECPKHGAASWEWHYRGSKTAPVTYVEHMAWCSAPDCGAGKDGAPWSSARIVRKDAVERVSCPTHGAEATHGADLPRVIDNDGAPVARLERKGTDAGWYAPRPGADTEWFPYGRERGTSYADNTARGDSIKHGSDRGRRGKQVRGESWAWIAANGDWRTKETAPTPDASAVVIRRVTARRFVVDSSGAVIVRYDTDGALPAPHIIRRPSVKDRSVKGGYRAGNVLDTVTTTARAALVKRDAALGAVLDQQAKETAPVRSRRNATNAAKPRPAARKSPEAKAETAEARKRRNALRMRTARAAQRMTDAANAVSQ